MTQNSSYKPLVVQLLNKFHKFKEPEISSPCSQQSVSGTLGESNESTLQPLSSEGNTKIIHNVPSSLKTQRTDIWTLIQNCLSPDEIPTIFGGKFGKFLVEFQISLLVYFTPPPEQRLCKQSALSSTQIQYYLSIYVQVFLVLSLPVEINDTTGKVNFILIFSGQVEAWRCSCKVFLLLGQLTYSCFRITGRNV